MVLKLLQLNIFHGDRLNTIIDFLKKEDFDIICLQELSGGEMSKTGVDNFSDIKKATNYDGVLNVSWRLKDEKTYFGNGILYKKTLNFQNPREFFMKSYEVLDQIDERWDERARSSVFADLIFDNKKITIGSTHLAWGPTPYDEPYKIEQAKKLFDFVSLVDNPLIITGDFNVPPQSEITKLFSEKFRNLTTENNLTNTLDLRNHKLKDIRPDGLAVDYIFASPEINILDFRILKEQELSDHLGLTLVFEI